VSDYRSVSYRCAECRENFGDPEREPVFETWHMVILLHVYNEHELSPDVVNSVLLPTYLEVLP
jgi:hypothetical protein